MDVAVEKIEERLPTELFKIVEKAINDVNQKSERVVQNNLRVTQNHISDKESVMLSDLLDVLYGRFEAIAESHRAVHEVIYKITEAEGMNSNKSLLAGFRGLWELYQSEVRCLHRLHLTVVVLRTIASLRFDPSCMTILLQKVVQHTGLAKTKKIKI